MREIQHREKFSKKFFFLPSMTDCKEQVNQYIGKVSLTPVDCLYKDFKKYSPSNKELDPTDLESHHNNRDEAVKTMYGFFKKNGCDVNLIRNVDYLVKKSSKLNYSELKWISTTQNKRFDNNRFQLDYSN